MPTDLVSRATASRLTSLLPALSLLYATVLFPLLALANPTEMLESRVEHRIFWPMAGLSSLLLFAGLWRAGARPRFSATTTLVLVYVLSSGASILWSQTPDITSRRFMQQVFVVCATMLPVIIEPDNDRIARNILLCLTIAATLNLVALVVRPATELGHAGLYTQKNVLGQFAAVSFLFSMRFWTPVRSRLFPCAAFVAVAGLVLLVASQSKTSLALVVIAPVVAGLVLLVASLLRMGAGLSTLLVFSIVLLAGVLLCDAFGLGPEDVSMALFQDTTFTGRTYIWAFGGEMAARHPFLGWGYQSFWLVGPDAPSVVEAPGFVATMPHAHNGYLDVMLETGWFGLAILLALILAAFREAGTDAADTTKRRWVRLSVVLFLVVYNLMESSWTRGFDLAWLLFLVVVPGAPIARRQSARGITLPSLSRPCPHVT